MKEFFNGLFALGLFCGLLLGFGLTEFISFSRVGDAIAAQYIAALLGALVGGCVSLITQMVANENERKKLEVERVETEKAILLTLLVRVGEMQNNAMHARIHQMSEDPRLRMRLGDDSLIKPLSFSEEYSPIPYEEKALLLQIGATDLFNTLNDLERFSRQLAQLQISYEEAFRKFETDLLSQGGQWQGSRVSSRVEVNRVDLLRLKSLNAHTIRILEDAEDDYMSFPSQLLGAIGEKYNVKMSVSLHAENAGTAFADID